MHIERRGLLIAGAAVAGGLVLGKVADRLGWWDATILGSPDPDDSISRVARHEEAVLIRAYDAALADTAIAGQPVAERLGIFRQHHIDHLWALGGGDTDVAAAPGPGVAPQGEPEGTPPLPALPTDPAGLPAYFSAAEQRHADLTSTGVRIASGGELARLLALITASETSHVVEWSSG